MDAQILNAALEGLTLKLNLLNTQIATVQAAMGQGNTRRHGPGVEGRARIAAAQKARWAKVNGKRRIAKRKAAQ